MAPDEERRFTLVPRSHYVAKLRYNVFHAVQKYEFGSTNTMIVLKQKEDRYHPNHFRQRNEVNGGHVLITREHVIPNAKAHS
jgi:hypothetical protein